MEVLLKLILPLIGLVLPSTAWAQEEANPSSERALASVEALVHGAETCAVGKRREAKMLAHIKAAGWTPTIDKALKTTDRFKRKRSAGIYLYVNENVQLTYFHSVQMRSCVAQGWVGAKFETAELLANLSERLARKPKVDTPDKKYLFHIKGAILTVQFHKLEGHTKVSLSTVRI